MKKFAADEAAKTDTKTRAQTVLDQIKGGADFAEMAKKYSDDGSAQSGGALDWFGKGEMVPAFETAAFSLKKGAISDLVETQYGYHIIKLDDQKTVTEKDASGKTVKVDQVKASHILFAFPTLGKYLDDQAKAATIHLYLKVHNPFLNL